MKVTITIEGELTPEGIIMALAGAWTCGEFEMNGELYKGYKAFGYGPCEMTYTTEEQP